MHDAKGRPLKAGDKVLIPCEIRDVSATPDYCNTSVLTLGGRKPDGAKESISAINTNVMIRANDGDDTAFEVVTDDGKTYLR